MRVAMRGIHELNALHDTAGIADDVRYHQSSGTQNKKRKVVYPPPTDKADRAMMIGEIVVTRNALSWVPGTMDEPKVRSVLNGMTVVDKSGDLLADLKNSIRPVGVSKKTIKYDASRIDLDPSDPPVVVLAGHLTTVNKGEEHIEAGDAVMGYLVPTDATNQYKDGVNYFSPNRIVVGTKPLRMEHTLKGAYYAKDSALYDAMQKVFVQLPGGAAMKVRFENVLDGKQPDGTPIADAAARHKNEMILNAMLHAARAATMAQMKNFVGVASTGADVGEKMNMLIHPITNLVSRGRPAIA